MLEAQVLEQACMWAAWVSVSGSPATIAPAMADGTGITITIIAAAGSRAGNFGR